MKKSISILLLVCMLVGMFSGTGFALRTEDESVGDNIVIEEVAEVQEEPEAEQEEPAEEPAPEESEQEPAEEPAEEPEAEEEVPDEEIVEEELIATEDELLTEAEEMLEQAEEIADAEDGEAEELVFGQVEMADTVTYDGGSDYKPTQIINGDFNVCPWQDFVYNGITYTGFTTITGGTVVEPKFNGVGEGWNTTAVKVFPDGKLYDWCKKVNGSYADNSVCDEYDSAVGGDADCSFIEMNGYEPTVFYQDLYTTGGDVMVWTLNHAFRGSGSETQAIHVEIGAPNRDSSGNILPATGRGSETKNTNIQPNSKAIYKSTGVTNPDASTLRGVAGNLTNLSLTNSKKGWQAASGIYLVPDGQTVTRFAFIADSPSNADGNLLDSITFSTLIGNLEAVADPDGSVLVTGYWGESDSNKSLKVDLLDANGSLIKTLTYNPKNTSYVVKTDSNGVYFSIRITAEELGGAKSVKIYHQDYPTAARTVAITQHTHCACGGSSCAGHDDEQKWTAWTATDTLPGTAGYWYLKNDVTISKTWEPVDGTYLCLNGHVIKMTGTGSVIQVNSGVSLTITDCQSTEHKFSVDSSTGLWTLNDSGSQTVTGGCITGGKGTDISGHHGSGKGGGVHVNGGSFTMNGGNLVGNWVEDLGGGVQVSSGTFTLNKGKICGNYSGGCGGGVRLASNSAFVMNGGEISYNTSAANGNGVQVDGSSASFTMTGGTISHNYDCPNIANNTVYKETYKQYYGGGGLLLWSTASFTMTGGTISDNSTAGPGGGLRCGPNATVTLGGTANITGNTNGTATNNLYLPSGKTVTVQSSFDGSVGVTTQTAPTASAPVPVSTAANSADYNSKFTSDAGYTVINDGSGSTQQVKLVDLASYAAYVVPYNNTDRPTSGSYTYYPSGYGTETTVNYVGVKTVVNGETRYYYQTVDMAIQAAQAGATNTNYVSESNKKGVFVEGLGNNQYTQNDTLNPDLGDYTDTVVLLKSNPSSTVLYNFGVSTTSYNVYTNDAGKYGINKGIIIDLNGHSISKLACGIIPDGQVLVVMDSKGTATIGNGWSGNQESDAVDDEGGTGYCAGTVVLSGITMYGKLWASSHHYILLNGQYRTESINKEGAQAGGINAGNIELRGGYYIYDPAGSKFDIQFNASHVEALSTKFSDSDAWTQNAYAYRVLKGAVQYSVVLDKNTTDTVKQGDTAYTGETRTKIYGTNIDLPTGLYREGYVFLGWASTSTATAAEYTSSLTADLSSEYNDTKTLYAVWAPAVASIDGSREGGYTYYDITYYTTLQAGLTNAQTNDEVELLRDTAENVEVAADKNLTLDLNGHVVSAKSSGSVITNKGTMTLKDSGSTSQKHYFVVGATGQWKLDDTKTAGTALSELTAIPAENDVIALTGGCITGGTGGSSLNIVGGGIVNNGTLEIAGGTVAGNTAPCGGGIFNSGSLTVSSGIISCNKAVMGGGLCSKGDSASLAVNGGSIICNSAHYGGGIYNFEDSVLTISDCTISYNNASVEDEDGYDWGCGGGVYNSSLADNIISGGTISGNTAGDYGGGIENGGKLTISGGIIGENSACYGGGVDTYINDEDSETPLTITGTVIIRENTADYGGGVHSDNGVITMTGGTITENTAEERGGGIYNYGYLEMTGGSVTDNTAGSYGGGVFAAANNIIEAAEQGPEFIVGGSVQITDNTVDGKASNVHLQDLVISPESANPEENAAAATDGAVGAGDETVLGCALMTIADGAKKPTTMKIGVSTYIEPTKPAPKQITTNGTAADAKYFTSDAGFYVRYLKNFGDKFPTAIYLTVDAADDEAAAKQAPATGDHNALGLWLALASVSVIAMGAVLKTKRKEH